MGRPVADTGKRDWDELTAEYGAMLKGGLGVQSPARSEGMGCKRSGRGQACERPKDPAPAECRSLGGDGLPEESPLRRRQAGAPGPYPGLPAGAAAADRALDAAQTSPEPLPGAEVGACALRVHQQVYLHPYQELMLRNHV
jgi:hypothetical protein